MELSYVTEALRRLRFGAQRWTRLAPREKIALLDACRRATAQRAAEWTALAAQAKGVAGTPLAGEEAVTGPWALLTALNALLKTLRDIDGAGLPQIEGRRLRHRADERIGVEVFPDDWYARMLLPGVRAEVWFPPGAQPGCRLPSSPARVVLILGAGNITSIAPLDMLYKLVAGNAACMVKIHPLLAYLQPLFEVIFAPLVADGYVTFVTGGAEMGSYLATHPLVDEVHVTGSQATYQALRREVDASKPISSELGNVSPTIVVPGAWSAGDIAFQAEHIVSSKVHNSGFNCVAPQILILPEAWDRRNALLDSIQRVWNAAPGRPAYYPGALERWEQLTGDARRRLVELDPGANEPLFTTEAFCPLLGIVKLPGETDEYLERAVSFANDRLAGTLAANLIADPQTLRERAQAIDRAVADLRYGCVGVNVWSGVAFLLPQIPWGAYSGNGAGYTGSGKGVVHNSRFLVDFEKAVVYGPFRPFPRPLWFVTNSNQDRIGAALCEFELDRSPARLAKVAIFSVI